MHPLLAPYSVMALVLLAMSLGRSRIDRAASWQMAWSAMGLVLFAALTHDFGGDLKRYHGAFLLIRDQPLAEVLGGGAANLLFNLLNWVIGQVTDHRRALGAVVAAASTLGLLVAFRRLFSAYHASLLVFIYSMYPFYIQYVTTGLKQALAMTCLLLGLVALFQHRRAGWLWLGAAPLFHTGAVLVFPFLALHLALAASPRLRAHGLTVMLALLVVTIGLSVAGLNAALLEPVFARIEIPSRYEIYFQDAAAIDYRTGFRLDFTLFSLIPMASYGYLRQFRYPLSAAISGWWLSLYTAFCMIYQLFSFAPFADRFAGFAWYLLPLVVMVQCVESRSRRIVFQLMLVFVLANIALLQFYTGSRLG